VDTVAVIASLGLVARRKQLLALGLTDRDLMVAVASGRVSRPHRGCFALPAAQWSSVQARVMSAQLTCVSALRPWGLPTPQTYNGLHLAIPEHRGFVDGDRRLRDGMRMHRLGAPQSAELLAPVRDVLDHLGLCTTRVDQLAAIDAALRLGLMSRADIASFTATPLDVRRWLAGQAEPLTQSPRETRARIELRADGLFVQAQAKLPGLGHADLLVENDIVVECDGFNFHNDKEAFEEDRRRDRACELLGLGRLRFTGAEIMASEGEIAAGVRTLMAIRQRQSRVPGAQVTGVTGLGPR